MSTTYQLEPFESEIKYPPLDRFPKNKNFSIPLWKPDQPQKCREIVLMLNGFMDGVTNDPRRREMFLIRYQLIAENLKSSNIAAALMPLPFHFMRSDDIEGHAPIVRLSEHGSYLYYGGYDQVIADVKKLISEIKGNPDKFGLNVPGEEVKFHLLGYSLGGVAAMGAAMQLEDHQFESLTVLLSAWNISEIDPKAIEQLFRKDFDFGEPEWNQMLKELKATSIEDDVFNQLIWGEEEITVPQPDRVKRILFIHGMRDEVFPRTMTARRTNSIIDKEDQNHCSFILLPDSHSGLRSRKHIAGYISNFIVNT
jgi:hypothetical protein